SRRVHLVFCVQAPQRVHACPPRRSARLGGARQHHLAAKAHRWHSSRSFWGAHTPSSPWALAILGLRRRRGTPAAPAHLLSTATSHEPAQQHREREHAEHGSKENDTGDIPRPTRILEG